MSDNKEIERLIESYFGKRFSLWGRALFGRWLRQDADERAKDEALRKLWEQANAVASEETRKDWLAIRRRLQTDREIQGTSRTFSIATWMKYVAVVALMVATGAAAYLLAPRLRQERAIEMRELFVANGESREILLPDGSTAWIDAGSVLLYPSDFEALETRTIYLTGEASFSVRKNKSKPFIVKTSYLDVEALGTIFTVSSYPSDSCSSALLEEGSVKVSLKDNPDAPVLLKPNEQLIYSHANQTARILQVDAQLYKLERSGYQIYENISFNELIASLERRYDVIIQYDSQRYAERHYNVKFAPHETLDDALDVLRQLVGIRYKREGKSVFIY